MTRIWRSTAARTGSTPTGLWRLKYSGCSSRTGGSSWRSAKGRATRSQTLLAQAGLAVRERRRDLAGIERVLCGGKSGLAPASGGR